MSVNKKIDEKELENAAGGVRVEYYSKQKCGSCGYENDTVQFKPTITDEGCDHYKTFTCPQCGYSWTIEL